MRKLFKRERRASQSVKFQQGVLGSGFSSGEGRVMRIGKWSEPVKGRVEASHAEKAEDICRLAKARSITAGLWDPERGKRVYTPEVFNNLKLRSEARLWKGADVSSSEYEKTRERSVARL